MAIKIIEADTEKDIDIFVNLLNKNFSGQVGRDRFEWLYLDNPRGWAIVWLVIDEKTDEAVAFTSALPRLISVDGKEIICWNCCDFSVNKTHRTLGVAVKLRREAKRGVDNGRVSALYAHPNDRMKLIHERVGHTEIGKMCRYVKLLSVKKQIRKRIGDNIFADCLSYLGDLILKMADTFLKVDNRYDVEVIAGEVYGEEYDRLYHETLREYKIMGERSADYLNWRYGRNPLYQTERIVIRDGDNQLAGYIIYYIEDGVAVFKDILCKKELSILNSLIGNWVREMRKRKIDSVSAIFMDKNPIIRSFRQAGFKIRPTEKSSVFAYAEQGGGLNQLWMNGENWYMTVGDRDV